jgi:glycosyltransferase involved in cell wall biosynthesis
VKLAVVVQRYGQMVNGGAELHARYVAEHLARHAEVHVLTTCATDYVTWRNDLTPGTEHVNSVLVHRFPVSHERHPRLFARRSTRVFQQTHSVGDELDWLDAEGPTTPALIAYLKRSANLYQHCLFFSYRYYHAYYGVRAAASRAILVPTAERDAAIGLTVFQPIFRGVRALMYNSPEERAMIHAVSGNDSVPGVVVGVGSEVPQNPQPSRFRQKYNVRGSFAVYVGRIDENKGCGELFRFFEGYLRDGAGHLSLVLIGHSLLKVPEHPRIRHVGFVDDMDKFDAIAAADLLIMPSLLESLSMAVLEAWALGRPVLVNGKCDVLKGQCLRSNGGLYYETYAEFLEALRALERNRWLSAALGKHGRHYYREHYDWPVIERKYLDMFNRLSREPAGKPIPPLPGWLARRSPTLPPAAEVLARIPTGPYRDDHRGPAERSMDDDLPSEPAAGMSRRPVALSQERERGSDRGVGPRSYRRGRGRSYRGDGRQR